MPFHFSCIFAHGAQAMGNQKPWDSRIAACHGINASD